MAAPLIRTKTPGVYKRGSRYVFRYRGERQAAVGGVPHVRRGAAVEEGARHGRRTAASSEERTQDHVARRTRASGSTDTRAPASAGSGRRRATSTAACWTVRAHATSEASMLLVDVGPKQIAEFIGWLVKQPNGRGGTLSDKSVRNALGPTHGVPGDGEARRV